MPKSSKISGSKATKTSILGVEESKLQKVKRIELFQN